MDQISHWLGAEGKSSIHDDTLLIKNNIMRLTISIIRILDNHIDN